MGLCLNQTHLAEVKTVLVQLQKPVQTLLLLPNVTVGTDKAPYIHAGCSWFKAKKQTMIMFAYRPWQHLQCY